MPDITSPVAAIAASGVAYPVAVAVVIHEAIALPVAVAAAGGATPEQADQLWVLGATL